jgi:hypothetical protein
MSSLEIGNIWFPFASWRLLPDTKSRDHANQRGDLHHRIRKVAKRMLLQPGQTEQISLEFRCLG